jgi:predicted nicotinamide N-methyase
VAFELGKTEIVSIDIGPRVLEIEQMEDMDGLMERAIVTGSPAPYWAYFWPSGRALAVYVGQWLDLTGKRVLELGCGLGGVSVACAAKGGAVIAADLVGDAIDLTKRNAARNDVEIEAIAFDWSSPPETLGKLDAIFASDVFYEDGMLTAVVRFLFAHLAPDGEAYITDPMRILPSAADGAARFRGLEVDHEVLVEPGPLERGVRLFRMRRRAKRLKRKSEM